MKLNDGHMTLKKFQMEFSGSKLRVPMYIIKN
jgi:hypothetical protein